MKAPEAKPSDFIYGIWFVGNEKDGDWMGTLWKPEGGGWIFEYRFRYYADEKAFGSEDVKHWYTATMADGSNESLAKILEARAGLNPVMEQMYGSKMDFVDLQCKRSDPKVLFELGSRPWVHIKMLPQGETP